MIYENNSRIVRKSYLMDEDLAIGTNPLVPQGPILLENGDPSGLPRPDVSLPGGVGIQWNFQDHHGHELISALLAKPLRDRRTAAEFVQFQWLILEGIETIRGFREFAEQEVKSKNQVFLYTCFLFADAEYMETESRLKLYEAVLNTKRQELLSALFDGKPCSKLFLKVLRLLADCYPSKDLISTLKKLTEYPAKSKVLPIADQGLDTKLVEAVDELPEWLCTPKIFGVLYKNHDQWNRLSAVFPPAILQAEPNWHKDIQKSLDSCTSLYELELKISDWTNKLFVNQPFPKPPFPGNHLLVPIQSSNELYMEGKEMNHCAAGYAGDVNEGKCYFYRWLGSERATVQMVFDDGYWKIHEQLGFENKKLNNKTKGDIHRTCAKLMKQLTYGRTKIAGTAYYEAGLYYKKFDQANPEELLLKIDPANEYDHYAVEVISSSGLKLGYIPRQDNLEYFAHLSRKLDLKASVLECRYLGSWLKIEIEIYLEA
jgi:hypothetical protein